MRGSGVMLMGPSGSGKSDLALRLIDRGATLLSDDVVLVETAGDKIMLRAAPRIKGKIEVRGVGICSVDYTDTAPLRLVIDLKMPPERMPPEDLRTTMGDFLVPLCHLDPFQPSSAIKAEFALRSVIDAARWPMTATTANTLKVQSFE
jgi:serine kinase of HPr protein (carbohydrate metabolism regulator)